MARYDLKGFEIPNSVVSLATITDFEETLRDAETEAPLQTFLEGAPQIWRCMLPQCRTAWSIPKPELGSEFEPDFLLAYEISTGINWVAVELEKPTKRPMTNAGVASAGLTQARGQVSDWRTWLIDNVAYARSTLGLRGIRGDCEAWIILGRRSMIDAKNAVRYSQLSSPTERVMTYDRILEAIRTSVGARK